MKILLGLLFIIFVGVLLVALHKRGVLKKVSLPEVGKISFLTSKRVVRTIILLVLVWFFWSLIRETGSSLYQWRSREFRAKPKASVQVNSACTYCLGNGCETTHPATVTGPGQMHIRSERYGTTAQFQWKLNGEGTWQQAFPESGGTLQWADANYKKGILRGTVTDTVHTPGGTWPVVLTCNGEIPHPSS